MGVETESCFVAQAGCESMVFLPQSPECFSYRHMTPCPPNTVFEKKNLLSAKWRILDIGSFLVRGEGDEEI